MTQKGLKRTFSDTQKDQLEERRLKHCRNRQLGNRLAVISPNPSPTPSPTPPSTTPETCSISGSSKSCSNAAVVYHCPNNHPVCRGCMICLIRNNLHTCPILSCRQPYSEIVKFQAIYSPHHTEPTMGLDQRLSTQWYQRTGHQPCPIVDCNGWYHPTQFGTQQFTAANCNHNLCSCFGQTHQHLDTQQCFLAAEIRLQIILQDYRFHRYILDGDIPLPDNQDLDVADQVNQEGQDIQLYHAIIRHVTHATPLNLVNLEVAVLRFTRADFVRHLIYQQLFQQIALQDQVYSLTDLSPYNDTTYPQLQGNSIDSTILPLGPQYGTCPKCNNGYEKISGCPHLRCPVCNHHFNH